MSCSIVQKHKRCYNKIHYLQESAELVLATSRVGKPPLDRCLLSVLDVLRGKTRIPVLRAYG